MDAYYAEHHTCGHADGLTDVYAIDLSGWQKVIENVAEQLHNGSVKPEDLDGELLNQTYLELNKATSSGFGKEWNSLGENAGIDPAVLKLQQNLFKFSGAKTFAQLTELNNNLTQNGKSVTWDEFKKAALVINDRYNVNHLQAEYQTAIQAGHHARNWEQYQKTKHLFPNLKYKTAGDKNVRKEHQRLEGIIAPIDSSFWKSYYPPNGWRCRCYVVQTAEKATKDIPTDVPEVKPEFKGNSGISNEVFNEGKQPNEKPHPYFQLANSTANRKKLAQSFEKAKLSAPYNEVYKKNNATLEVSPFADLNDLEDNVRSAKTIVEHLQVSVKIRPHLDRTILPGKNPEYLINDRLSDLKSRFKKNNYKGINNAFKDAKDKGLESIVFDFSSFTDLDIYEINRWICSNINGKRGKSYQEIIFINGEKVVLVPRKTIVDKMLIPELKKIAAEP